MRAFDIWCKSSQKIRRKLTVKYFNSILLTFLYSVANSTVKRIISYLAFRLGDMMYFSRTSTFFSDVRKLCESSVKFSARWKYLASNSEAIMTYWPLKNTFPKFYKRGSATFKLINCLDRISLIGHKKQLNGKFKKKKELKSKSSLLFIAHERVNI